MMTLLCVGHDLVSGLCKVFLFTLGCSLLLLSKDYL